MLNIIWPFMIIISLVFGLCTGRIEDINNAIFASFEDTVNMIINFLGIMCFWSGMINVLKNTRIMVKIENLLKPFVNKIFGTQTEKAKELISINIVSNLFGIGNAATPIGIKAMKEMDANDKNNKMSFEMNMFVLLNTLSIQLIPTTIISVRASLGAENGSRIIFPVWIVSVLTFFIVMTMGVYIFKKDKCNENV